MDLAHRRHDISNYVWALLEGHLPGRPGIWGYNTHVNTHTLETHVSRVRNKLGLVPESDWRLSPVYQHGYRLEKVA